MEKQRKQTRTAVILDKMGIPVLDTEYREEEKEKWFEQSSVVKKNCDTLNNHSRMMGILYSPGGFYDYNRELERYSFKMSNRVFCVVRYNR